MGNFVLTEKINNYTGAIITDIAIRFSTHDKPIIVKGMWDTGATISHISKELVDQYKLKSVGRTTLTNSSDEFRSNLYEVDVVFDTMSTTIYAAEVDNLKHSGFDFVVGMDVITCGDFALSVQDGILCFSFRIPSNGFIDFSEETK